MTDGISNQVKNLGDTVHNTATPMIDGVGKGAGGLTDGLSKAVQLGMG